MKKILVVLSFLVFQMSLLGMSINNKKTEMEVTVSKVKEGYQFTVKAPTTGWVGIGFEASMIMKDAEMILMTNKDGKGFVEHYYGTGATKISSISTLDKNYKNDNLKLISYNSDGKNSTYVFLRTESVKGNYFKKLDGSKEIKVLYAWSETSDMNKKHKKSGTEKIKLPN